MTEDAFYAAATLLAVAAVDDQPPRIEVGTFRICAAERGRSNATSTSVPSNSRRSIPAD